MSDDTKKTNESPVVENPENTEESLTPEELGNETPDPVNDVQPPNKELDFGELMPTGKRSPDTRAGLSRKEFTDLKKDETPPEPVQQTSDEELDSIKAEHRKILQESKQFQAADESRFIKNMFDDAMRSKGVDAEYFNEHLKEGFTKKYSELTEKGLSKVDAGQTALDLMMAGVSKDQAVKEAEERAQGRVRAKLPPSSSRDPKQVIYKLSTITAEGFPQADYDRIMALREQGKVRVLEDK